MVDGVKVGSTAEETTANVRVNREFLEKVVGFICGCGSHAEKMRTNRTPN